MDQLIDIACANDICMAALFLNDFSQRITALCLHISCLVLPSGALIAPLLPKTWLSCWSTKQAGQPTLAKGPPPTFQRNDPAITWLSPPRSCADRFAHLHKHLLSLGHLRTLS